METGEMGGSDQDTESGDDEQPAKKLCPEIEKTVYRYVYDYTKKEARLGGSLRCGFVNESYSDTYEKAGRIWLCDTLIERQFDVNHGEGSYHHVYTCLRHAHILEPRLRLAQREQAERDCQANAERRDYERARDLCEKRTKAREIIEALRSVDIVFVTIPPINMAHYHDSII